MRRFPLALVLALLPLCAQERFQLPIGPRQTIERLYAVNRSPTPDAEEREAMRRSLKSKDQFTQSMAHLHQQAAARIERSRLLDRSIVNAFSTRQRNRQGGESAASGGTTSLTSLAGAADFISAAFESGALARQSEGTVTTFRISGYGMYTWLTRSSRPCSLSNPFCDTPVELQLRGLSGSVSIDNAKPEEAVAQSTESVAAQNPVLTRLTGGGRLSSASVRYEFLQRVTPAKQTEIDGWRTALQAVEPSAAELSLALQEFMKRLNSDLGKEFNAWVTAVSEMKESQPQADFERKYLSLLSEFYLNHYEKLLPSAESLEAVATKREEFHGALEKALKGILLKPALTLEYVYAHPTNQASISTLRFIADKKFAKSSTGGGGGDVDEDSNATATLNIGVNFFNKIPTGITSGRVRDAQISGEIERSIGPASRKLRHSVSLAGYYQYQIENAILMFNQTAVTPGPSAIPLPDTAAVLLGTKGHIGIVQGKLTLRLSESLSIPLAVSWSNRTELLPKDPTWRAQAGVTLNVGKLLSQ